LALTELKYFLQEQLTMFDYWINKAIRYCGSQKKLARRMGMKPERISYLLNTARKISIEDAILIEQTTDNTVSRYQLLNKLSPLVKRQLNHKSMALR
jgi:DNA-binding transcriptional regulator YdaS (Cro superfamily)